MPDHEGCINVNLSDTHSNICSEVAKRAVEDWRGKGIDEPQIQSVLNHIWPGIWPSFATPEEIDSIREGAAKKLGVDKSKVKIDGIRQDGLVNLFVDW
jgi:hypothetical protein